MEVSDDPQFWRGLASLPSPAEWQAIEALSRAERLVFLTHRYEREHYSIHDVTCDWLRAQGVSKPVVYEHFGRRELDGKESGAKESLYAVIVDREIASLLSTIETALNSSRPRQMLEQAAFGFLTYIEDNSEGFQILVRDSPVGMTKGSFSSLITDIAMRVQHLLASEFKRRKLNPKMAPLYAQSLVGMVALTGQWWLDERKPGKKDVAAHIVNLAWNGLHGLEVEPKLRGNY